MAFWNRKRNRNSARSGAVSILAFAEAFGVIRSTSGATVTPMTAENLSTLFACVQAITAGIASLPALVYRKTENGREEAPDHPLSRLIRDGVNDRESWPDFVGVDARQCPVAR